MSKYDIAIVGSGPGGYAAALAAARRKRRTVLIERGDWGGVCLNVGCIPTKSLLAVSRLASRLRHADSFGIRVQGFSLDFPAVMERNARIVRDLRYGLMDLLRREGVELVQGTARFEDPHTLHVSGDSGDRLLQAERLVIAGGARPASGPWKLDEQRLLSYRGLLALSSLPASLLIVGGGVIGCEFASCFAAFGTQVTLVEQQEQLLPQEDADAVRWLVRRLEASGVRLHTGSSIASLAVLPDGVKASLTDDSTVSAERCLIAIGTRPDLEALNLDAAKVRFDRAVEADAFMRTSQPHIAAVGDCLEGHGLAHWASAEGVHAVDNFLRTPEPFDTGFIPRCVYTDPEIASVGRPPVPQEGVRVGRFSFAALGKSHCDGETEGLVKLAVDASTDRVLGAVIVGAQASSLIHSVVLAMRHGLTARQLAQTITAHPSWPEAVTEAAASLYGESLCVVSRSAAQGFSAGASRGG